MRSRGAKRGGDFFKHSPIVFEKILPEPLGGGGSPKRLYCGLAVLAATPKKPKNIAGKGDRMFGFSHSAGVPADAKRLKKKKPPLAVFSLEGLGHFPTSEEMLYISIACRPNQHVLIRAVIITKN